MAGSEAGNEARKGVAIIAVHGVADQKAGNTAQAIAQLLVASPPAGARYLLHSSDELALRVESLAPSAQAHDGADRPPPTPSGPRPLAKAMAQSMRSDLHRSEWVVDDATPGAQAASAPLPNPGIELTDFLLFKAARNDTPTAAYETTRLKLERSEAEQPPQRVDVYEMYWADLSRLASGVPRILTELFTLLFRLSQLGRDTVALAARQFDTREQSPARWQWFSSLQACLDWAFAKGLGLLTLQLFMAAMVIVPVGLSLQVPAFADVARQVLAWVLPVALMWWCLYRFDLRWRSFAIGAVASASLCVLLARPPAHWVVGAGWLAMLSLAYDRVMRICDERFPMTRFSGWVLWGASLCVLLASAAMLPGSSVPGLEAEQGLRIFTFGALRTVEVVLAAMVLWWGVAGVALFAWLMLGQACARTNGFEGRATVATGRMGLSASMSFFVVLTMATWAALTPLLDLSVAGMHYLPLIFRDPAAASPVLSAASFLDARYENSTETFSLIVLLLVAMVAYMLFGFVPSLLAEMKLLRSGATRLGRWLTAAYRTLDIAVTLLVVMGALAAVVVGVALNSRWVGPTWLHAVNAIFPQVPHWSQDILSPLIWTAASATVALSALGRVLSRYVPWLRAPLDVALDVDSHFREFPRRAIPRARIFSRYAALLQHVAQQGYERIVIVAHSQGTVISAELLRYLRFRAAQASAGSDDEVGRWARRLEGRVHLLTAGCPLRQIYAARFPGLYRWVLHDDLQHMGPTAAGLGVQRWVNAYTTGDYVGRWLWSRLADAKGEPSDAMVDEFEKPGDVYAPALAEIGLPRGMAARAELDVCLGVGAHTHYFEPEQVVVAGLIDQLAVTPWLQEGDTALGAAREAA